MKPGADDAGHLNSQWFEIPKNKFCWVHNVELDWRKYRSARVFLGSF
jgi:hypothetical protein